MMPLLQLFLPFALALSVHTPAPPTTMPLGHFVGWQPKFGPWRWVSGGMTIDIAAAACDSAQPSEMCRVDGVNSKTVLTVRARGARPYRAVIDDMAAYFRIAVVRFDRRDTRMGVVIENQSLGSAGIVYDHALVPERGSFRRVEFGRKDDALEGELPGVLSDVSGDGRLDFVLRDGRFGGTFACNGCSPRPPIIFTLRGGRMIDVSADRAFAGVFRDDIVALRRTCASDDPERNGACAAYAADAARLGQFASAWRNLKQWYARSDPGFPTNLHAYLRKTGYIR